MPFVDHKEKNWKEIVDGAIIDSPGTARNYSTGSWKRSCPQIDLRKCVHCLLCWWYCPDSCFLLQDSKVVKIDLDHCKGCGICAEVCPPKVKAIEMAKIENNNTEIK